MEFGEIRILKKKETNLRQILLSYWAEAKDFLLGNVYQKKVPIGPSNANIFLGSAVWTYLPESICDSFHDLSKMYTNAQFCFACHPCTRIFRENCCLQIQCKIEKIPQEKRYFMQQSQNRHYWYLKALIASFGRP